MIRKTLIAMLLIICTVFTGTACSLFSNAEDLGLKHLQERYPDYTFSYSSYGSSIAYYDVEGFEGKTDESGKLIDNSWTEKGT